MSESMTDANATCRPGILVISGPSGTGKTTLVNRLIAQSPVPLKKSVSATTRSPRAGEVDGDDYYFLSREEFLKRVENNEFLEYEEVHKTGQLYGTLKSHVDNAINNNCWSLLEVDVDGMKNITQIYPDAVTIFLLSPSQEVYEQRLRSRGTESEELITRRLQTAQRELTFADRYQYQVVNDQLDRAVQEICDILTQKSQLTSQSN
jgi:guanylate kinase